MISMTVKASEYDQYMIPGDIELAKKHELSCEVGAADPYSEVCKSSKRHTIRKKMSMWCKTEELEFLGPGVPLFFRYIRNCLVILFFTMMIYSVQALKIFSESNSCKTVKELGEMYPNLKGLNNDDFGTKMKDKYPEICVKNWATALSYANVDSNTDHTGI